jgi:tRNA nucleotidyltransferase/poly(A) polymerase
MTVLPGLEGGKLRDRTPLKQGTLALALEALSGAGEETRLVGGAVRDLALGSPVLDLDLATTAPPDEVIRRAHAAGFKVALTGVAHGTVTVIVEGRPIEATTLRQDVETDGRRAKVMFGRDFSADARRRDFTINALSLGPDGTVHDYVGGLEDLAQGRVRFIGDAGERIREDYLRTLRFFRLSARYARGALDAEGLSAAIRARNGLARLSRERVRAELMKLLTAPRASDVVQTMGECGFLEPILGGLAYPRRLSRLVAIETARGHGGDAVVRLVALGAAIREDAERLRDRLRLANAEYDRIASAAAALIGLHGIAAPPSLNDLRALLFTAGRVAARDALALAHAESGLSPADAAFATADRFLADAPEPKLPSSGADLIARGVAEGPQVGRTLRALQALWIRAGFPEEPETLTRLIEEAVESARAEASTQEDGVDRGA